MARRDIELDADRIDDAVLALLSLTLHDGDRAWKGFDFESLGRLRDKGFVLDPFNKTKSIVLTEEGLTRSTELARKLFARQPT